MLTGTERGHADSSNVHLASSAAGYSRPRCATRFRLYNAASSAKALRIDLLIVAIGFPFVLAYTAVVYWTFRGRPRLQP